MKRKLMLSLLLPLLFCFGCAARAQNVAIAKNGDDFQIHAANYDATVASDGAMTSLKIGGAEFLNPKVSISRGVYFHQTDVPKLPRITQNGAALTADGDTASMRYEFAPGAMTWTATNKTAAPMALYAVFDKAMRAVKTGDAWNGAPANVESSDPMFFIDKARLQIKGGNRIWGPWENGTQVWETSLAPNETRTIQLNIGAASAEEATRVAQLVQVALDAAITAGEIAKPEPDLAVLSPKPFQVVQRQTRTRGDVLFSGRVKPVADAVQARISGGKALAVLKEAPMNTWRALPFVASTRSFNGMLPVAAGGWYKIEIRALKGGKVVAEAAVENVGVGEVFVGSGQSNSTNYGGEGGLQTQTKMVTTFDGDAWRLANDPQPGSHDKSGGGSFWPAFGDAMATRYGVPIGVAVTGHGGTSVNQWQPNGELFDWTLTRVRELGVGGFRAMLWHQGETDTGMTSAEYALKLTKTIHGMQSAADWAFPWIVAQVSYHTPNDTHSASTRDAQAQLWRDGIALEGPDTDALGGDNRDAKGQGIHLSPKGLTAHGKLWAEKVGVFLDKELK